MLQPVSMVRTTAAQAPSPLLYSFRRCPYAMRARLALAVSTTSVVMREVKLSAKPAAMLAVSPKGTVPVLLLPDGHVIDESLDVMRWTLARHDPERWLDGDDRALIGRNDGDFKHALDRYKYPDRHGVDPLVYRDKAISFLSELDDRLSRTDQLCGSARSLTDAAIVPFVRQFAAVDRQWFNGLPLQHLQRWLADHMASPLFNLIMLRVAPWAPGDKPLLFPPAPQCDHQTPP